MKRKGFSLIELMIVIAIIAILASFAIPTYQAYMMKVRVGEGLHLAEMQKLAVADYVLTTHELPASANDITLPFSPTENVQSISVGPQGVITITYSEKIQNATLQLIPTINNGGNITWRCHLGTLDKQYAPSSCIRS